MQVSLHKGDCLEALKTLPDNSVDLVVTDCPYKIVAGGVTIEEREDECSGVLRKRVKSDGTKCSNKWIKKDIDSVPSAVKSGKMFSHNDISFEDWLPDVYRVLKEGCHCYIMINGRNLKDLQVAAENISSKKTDCFKFVNLLAWRKNNMTPNKYYMQQLEFVLLLRKGSARNINNMGTSNCLDIPNIIGKKTHPTEKPVELMRIFIENSSNAGDVVLDPFMGSGSTGVACVNTGRNFIGIELDEQYFNIAQDRINKAKSAWLDSLLLEEVVECK